MAMQNLKDQSDYRRLLAEFYGVDYSMLGEIYTQKLFWQFKLQNYADRLGIAQRICKDTSNLCVSGQIRISTPVENANTWIDNNVFGRLQLPSILNKNYPYALGLGDMLLTAYRDPVDQKPAINYIPIYNVLPITFNNHSVTKLAWFNVQKIDQDQYITSVVEEVGKRTIQLFQVSHGKLLLIEYMSPLWINILGKNTPQVVEYTETNAVQKFDWISTGLFNARWMNTPFHNGLIWPFWLINKVEWAWDLLQEEYEASRKRIFVDSSLVKSVNSELVDPVTGQPVKVKEFNWESKTYEVVDLGSADKKIQEYNPQVRFTEFTKGFEFQLKFLATVVGLGPTFYTLENMKVEMTATQVNIQHREAAETVSVMKLNLIAALQTIIYALLDYAVEDGELTQQDLLVPTSQTDEEGNQMVRPMTKYDISIEFDDSAFVSSGAKTQEGINIFNSVGMSRYDFYTKWKGITKSEALAMIQRHDQEIINNAQLQMALMPDQGGEEEKEEPKDKKKPKGDK